MGKSGPASFMRVSNRDGDLAWVAALVDGALYAWVPNLRSWHRHGTLEVDFYADQELTYAPLTPAEAAALLPDAPPVSDLVLAVFTAQPATDRLTSADLGLAALPAP